MYALAIIVSIVLTAIAFYSVRLMEKKTGSSENKIGLSFTVPVFIFFLALVYKKATEGNCLLFETLLLN